MKKLLTLSSLMLCSHFSAMAISLTFDASAANNQSLDQGYGDNVTATTMGAFQYGAAGGFTPNITVTYGPSSVASPAACPFNTTDCVFFWDTGFSNLTNVIGQASRGANNGLIQIVLTASSGFLVQLSSLDLGSWAGAAQTINGVRVLDASSALVFNSGALVLGASATAVNPNVTSSQLTLIIDGTNLAQGTGELIAVDNVTFSQLSGVPEPATYALVGGALALLALGRRRS